MDLKIAQPSFFCCSVASSIVFDCACVLFESSSIAAISGSNREKIGRLALAVCSLICGIVFTETNTEIGTGTD